MKNKRNLFFILIISTLMLLSVFVMANAEDTLSDNVPQAENFVLGDVDGDGKITITDYMQIKSSFCTDFELKGKPYAMADVNFDDKINSLDYLIIKNSLISSIPLDDSEWSKYEGKEQIKFASVPSALPYDYFANMLGDDLQFGYENTGEYSDSSYDNVVNDAYSYDPYTGIYNVVKNPYEHPDAMLTTTDFDGNSVNLSYSNFVLSFDGYYDVYKNSNFSVYVDKDGNIIGKRYVYYKDTTLPFEKLSEEEIKALANSKRDELGLSLYKFSSITYNSTRKEYTVYYDHKINGIKSMGNFLITIKEYGSIVSFSYNNQTYDKYDLRSFGGSKNESYYYSTIKNRADYLLSNFVCECLSSKNPDDYTFDYEITDYFITYDGKMAAKAYVVFTPIPENDYSHVHTFSVYFYM